ncbi:MAG: SRPBCC family protein [Gemmatimonadetes bacterium]|nr:SRPBCC family protein [Gemmatimonadota bacterium]
MTRRTSYEPGPAQGARVDKSGDAWTLVVVRELPHPPAKVWKALTQPEHLSAWAPFDADRNMGVVGPVTLTTVNAPTAQVSETKVTRADFPTRLEFSWGGQEIRWELEPVGATATRLTLWHNIAKPWIAMGAAGWHLCLDVLAHALADDPIGRIVGPDAMKFGGWQRLLGEYSAQFGVELPSWGPKAGAAKDAAQEPRA